jgi:hypothetical protein
MADETEADGITLEMIEAGARVLSENAIDLGEGFISPSILAPLVWEAMAQCCPELRRDCSLRDAC